MENKIINSGEIFKRLLAENAVVERIEEKRYSKTYETPPVNETIIHITVSIKEMIGEESSH